jgi:hypothetical protein
MVVSDQLLPKNGKRMGSTGSILDCGVCKQTDGLARKAVEYQTQIAMFAQMGG